MAHETPLACTTAALNATQQKRREILAQEIHTVTQEVVENSDGYAFRLSPEYCLTVAEFISLERECCPFFTFKVELERDHGPLWFQLTGPTGVKEFLREELGLLLEKSL